MLKKITIQLVVVLAVSALMNGCALSPPHEAEPTKSTPEKSVVNLADKSDIEPAAMATDDLFIAQPLNLNDPMPRIDINIPALSSNRVYDLMQTLLAGKDISFSISGANTKLMRRNVSATNITGDLEKILDDFSNSVGFYWNYKSGIIHIAPDRQFIANIPPINDLFESLPPMFQTMGATDVFVDKTSHMVTFKASRVVFEKIESYLKHIRDNKKMISYDVFVWQIVLDGAHANGIRWDKLDEEIASKRGIKHRTTSTDAAFGSGFSSTFGRNELPIDVLEKFLSTQGKIHAISQPKMSMISGGKSTFRVGNTTVYAKQVGTDTISGVARTTVTTAQALSGIDLTVGGNMDGETVYTDIQMKLNDLLRFNLFSANGISVQMPQNANRELSTVAHIRPGDSLLLAGINISSNDETGPVKDAEQKNSMKLPNSMSESGQRTELVMVFRPSVLSFVHEAAQPKAKIEVNR